MRQRAMGPGLNNALNVLAKLADIEKVHISDANAFQNLYRDLLESQKAWRSESAKAHVKEVAKPFLCEDRKRNAMPNSTLQLGCSIGVFAVSGIVDDDVNESSIVALLAAWDTTPRLLEKVFEEDKTHVDIIEKIMEDMIVKWPNEKYTQASITHLVQKFQTLKGYETQAGLVQSHFALAIVTSTIEKELHATEGQTTLEDLQQSMKQLKAL
eukprot:1067648-Amphidinium_carterae.1